MTHHEISMRELKRHEKWRKNWDEGNKRWLKTNTCVNLKLFLVIYFNCLLLLLVFSLFFMNLIYVSNEHSLLPAWWMLNYDRDVVHLNANSLISFKCKAQWTDRGCFSAKNKFFIHLVWKWHKKLAWEVNRGSRRREKSIAEPVSFF